MEGRLIVWCVRFLEARWIQPERIGKGPIPPRRRVIVDLGLEQLARLLRGKVMVELPDFHGAGPCGTLARRSGPSPLTWSIEKLLPPLREYYASLPKGTIYPKLGAKAHPRGRSQALAIE